MSPARASQERHGTEPAPPSAALRARLADSVVELSAGGNARLAQLVAAANADERVRAWWHLSAVNSIRAGINDHSSAHAQAVADHALTLLRLLGASGVEPDTVSAHGLGGEDAEVVVAAAALLHDVGMAASRAQHEAHALALLAAKLDELLGPIYAEPERSVVQAEILHAVVEHRSDGCPLTLEGDVVRVADALDMTHARSRGVLRSGRWDVDALSAAAVAAVEIRPGAERAIRIDVTLTSSAGLFQLEQRLAAKLRGSRLEPHVEVVVDAPDEPELALIAVPSA